MRPEPPRRPARGFGMIAAIVVLVILAALGGFIATLSTTQHAGAALDVQGARAIFAAQSGVEWGVYHAIKTASPPCAAAPGTNTDIGSIDGIAVTVNCTTLASGSAIEAGLGAIYRVTATACNLPSGTSCPGTVSSPLYVERRVTALPER